MGLFDRFRKKTETAADKEPECLRNYPEMLTVKLLFVDKPNLDAVKILEEAKNYFVSIENPSNEKALIFSFPELQIELADAKIPVQCLVVIPDEDYPDIEIPDVAFQQNWHWQEANETAKSCKYELIVTDFMTRTLEYKQRVSLFMNFLVAVTKATNPDVIYSVYGQKLIKPADLTNIWDKEEKQLLYCICNVRIYNLTDANELLMDTIGLNSIGLPNFQIRFKGYAANEIANLLWNYAYYIYEKGDVIENGNTLEGIISGSKWKCERQVSLLDHERIVVNVQPN
jgi:Domain of unknown function (DUF4261)